MFDITCMHASSFLADSMWFLLVAPGKFLGPTRGLKFGVGLNVYEQLFKVLLRPVVLNL